ncbi:MAG: amidase [Alphaproteobacteria bacterium]|nr:amidase [Alphaproteobacteria bacterium]MDI9329942.1 amidase [Alphaproteobacteria bacterium]
MVFTQMSAKALSQAIHRRDLSCREVMQACLDQVALHNPRHLAIINLQNTEQLLRQSEERDALLARGQSMGWMHGLPIAIKDLAATAGITTTLGSPLMKLNVPSEDAAMVARIRRAGAIVIGKTNVPEFGLGSHSFNEVFGTTANAYDPSKTSGGSSGGAAVALALRMLPVADGSDFMGSLRNPAGWNNIFGMRPSQGRVPGVPTNDIYVSQMPTDGPMGRHVADLALLLSTQAGPDPRAPLSLGADPSVFTNDLNLDVAGLRVGWLGDLNGYLATEPGVLQACEAGLGRLQTLGCVVDTTCLNTPPEQVWETWLAWRKVLVASRLAPFMQNPDMRAQVKPEAQWEYDQGQGISAGQFMAASVQRSAFYQGMLKMFEQFDVLALPSAQVWPFDKTMRWPQTIHTANGPVAMDTYHRWMEVVIYATLAGLPSISVPTGFGPGGLPMGLQLIGKPQGDFALLQLAHMYEQAIGDWLAVVPPGLG